VRLLFDSLGRDIRGVPIPGEEIPRSDAELLAGIAMLRSVSSTTRAKRKSSKFPTITNSMSSKRRRRCAPRSDGAAYYPAPPFKTTGVGRFYVTPTDNESGAARREQEIFGRRSRCARGFPGHDWYYKVMSADRPSPVRWLTPGEVEGSSSMWEDSMSAEGWALYAEALMAEPQKDAPEGFYTPVERLFQCRDNYP